MWMVVLFKLAEVRGPFAQIPVGVGPVVYFIGYIKCNYIKLQALPRYFTEKRDNLLHVS